MKTLIHPRYFLFLMACMLLINLNAQQTKINSLNKELQFCGDYLLFKGKKIVLGTKALYVDGQLTNEEVKKYRYVFNSVNDAVMHLTNGTEAEPMTLYIAPWVYWIDNPDDPEIRLPKEQNGTPFGLEITCDWLHFYGLTDNPRDVVLAANRGQTMGAKGNFTMMRIAGDGTAAENITFGNYCNIDLEYPLNPELNRKKRSSAIVQAQLVFCFGDKLMARNTRFVSRLNLCPFWGGKRTLFDRCHFECTDDALSPTAVYLNCTFDFYSSKPFGHTSGTGVTLLNCDIRSFTRGDQYFVKGNGPVTAVDCRMVTSSSDYWGWRANPEPEARYYEYNNKVNDKMISIDTRHDFATVTMNDKPILDAYKFESGGKTVYNTYNLLRGNDDWDPMGIKDIVINAESELKKPLTGIPTMLIISPTRDTVETGKNKLKLQAFVKRFGNFPSPAKVKWEIPTEYQKFVSLHQLSDSTCEIIPENREDVIHKAIVTASTANGLEAATVIYVSPEVLDAPEFSSAPSIIKNKSGELLMKYALKTNYPDQSDILWYRCKNEKGENPVEVKVSRFNTPLVSYKITSGDIGWYIMAKISPKHIRSESGKPVSVNYGKQIGTKDIQSKENILIESFKNVSFSYQPEVIRGFWTVDSYAPADTYDWSADNSKPAWYYGKGVDGAANDTGLVQAVKGARIRYTPVADICGSMKISFTAITAKTAGQGFSSARQQYMDVFIKFDNHTLSGYALRLIRTTKYADAIDFVLMKYENGIATPVSKAVSADCYRPDCKITLEINENVFKVHAENSKPYYVIPNRPEVAQVVDLETTVQPDNFGGFGFQHTGTVDGGATLIRDLIVEWK